MLAPQFANFGGPSVPNAVPSPAGLRACFAGENNVTDVVSNNVGGAVGTAGFTGGRFGQGFTFNALADGFDIPNSASLNFGASAPGITMAAWIFGTGQMFQVGSGIYGSGPIIEFDNGAHLWHHSQQGNPLGLFTNLVEPNGTWHILAAQNAPSVNAWHHTAVTYVKSTGALTLYIDGNPVATSFEGTFNPNTGTTLHIGRRATPVLGDADFTFRGVIDEVQLYDRGLPASEVTQLASATGTMCVPPPVSYQVAVMPVSSGESGVPFSTQPQVVILDANDNVVSNATTAVTATVTSGTGTLLGTTTVNAVNGVATFTDLAIAGAGNTTIGFTTATLPAEPGFPTTSGQLATIQVPRQLAVTTQPGGATSGAPLSPQPVVEVRDAANLRVPGSTNSVTVSLSAGPGALSGPVTVNASNGTASFSGLIITGAGMSTLSFASTGLTGTNANPVNILGAPPALIQLTTAPAGGESGMPFTTQPVVEIIDAVGNRATAATGSVTAQIVSGTGTLVGTTSVTVSNGLATFTNLQINGYGTFGLRFTYASLTPVNATLPVIQKVRQLAVLSAPPTITSGVVMTPPWVVAVRDAAGITVAGNTYLVRANIGAGSAVLTGTVEINAVNGILTFTNLVATGSGVIQLSFWVTQPDDYAVAFVFSNNLTLQANNGEPPPPPPPPPPLPWAGFYAPIDNLPAINKNEGGSTIPIKFSLGSNLGLAIFAPGYPKSQQANCTTWEPIGDATQISVPGVLGGLTGDPNILAALKYSDNKYQIDWKTEKAWDGTCRILQVKLIDTTVHTAKFLIK